MVLLSSLPWLLVRKKPVFQRIGADTGRIKQGMCHPPLRGKTSTIDVIITDDYGAIEKKGSRFRGEGFGMEVENIVKCGFRLLVDSKFLGNESKILPLKVA